MNASLLNAASAIDPKLAARAGQSDHLAFSKLYDQSSTVLFSLAVRILGNREEAAEVLQGLYADVWKKSVRYDVGRGTPIAWLLTLTRSRAIDRLRASASRVPRRDEGRDDVLNPAAGEFEAPADQALRTVISNTWSELPPALRQAIELSYYEGLHPVDITTKFGQPLDAVMARLRLGMSKLRESLCAYWEQDRSA